MPNPCTFLQSAALHCAVQKYAGLLCDVSAGGKPLKAFGMPNPCTLSQSAALHFAEICRPPV